jgi:hypothetical protein
VKAADRAEAVAIVVRAHELPRHVGYLGLKLARVVE